MQIIVGVTVAPLCVAVSVRTALLTAEQLTYIPYASLCGPVYPSLPAPHPHSVYDGNIIASIVCVVDCLKPHISISQPFDAFCFFVIVWKVPGDPT